MQEVLKGVHEKFLRVKYTHCSYVEENLLTNGWSNDAQHYPRCVGVNNLSRLVSEQLRRNKETETKTNSKDIIPFIIATDAQKSTHMWLKMVTSKNQSFADIECPLMQSSKKNAETKSASIVKKTGFHLSKIVEKKIKKISR